MCVERGGCQFFSMRKCISQINGVKSLVKHITIKFYLFCFFDPSCKYFLERVLFWGVTFSSPFLHVCSYSGKTVVKKCFDLDTNHHH